MPPSLERHQTVVVSPKSMDIRITVSLRAPVAYLQARCPRLISTVAYNCEDMEADFSITISQLETWNTWMGSNCDAALYANLAYEDTRAICIGVNGSAPTSTTTASPTSTTTTASMGPTQTGIVAGCQEFYTVQSGDGCGSIETKFSITFAQFYAWNPSGMSPIPSCLSALRQRERGLFFYVLAYI